jgi:hypothetical protein
MPFTSRHSYNPDFSMSCLIRFHSFRFLRYLGETSVTLPAILNFLLENSGLLGLHGMC